MHKFVAVTPSPLASLPACLPARVPPDVLHNHGRWLLCCRLCCSYGFPTEVKVNYDGSFTAIKHFTFGRISSELAYVMPDR